MEPNDTERSSDSSADIWTRRLFVLTAMAILFIPLVLTLLHPTTGGEVSSEKRELAPAPRLVVNDVPNPEVLVEAGNYYADHFALRAQLVDLDATVLQSLFITSAVDSVVAGSDGWLYYTGEMGDYQRTGLMSDHALHNAAHNLSLVQEAMEARGKRFVVAIAPNKSSLYPSHVPYYRVPGQGDNNYTRLMQLLAEHGVHTVDLRSVFSNREGEWYLHRDSHWTDEGALVAFEAIRTALGRNATIDLSERSTDDSRVGDLDAMLHPVSAKPEFQGHWTGVDRYSYANDASSVEDNYIVTNSLDEEARGSLLMYRDSFGNALLPPFATAYGQAVFTKLVPYDMSPRMCSFANDVVVERAERHLAFFASNPPYMPSPVRTIAQEGEPKQTATTVAQLVNGPYLVVEGTLVDEEVRNDERVFVEVALPGRKPHTYEAFCVSQTDGMGADFEGQAYESSPNIVGDAGYRVYVELPEGTQDVPSGCRARVLVGTEEQCVEVGSTMYESGESKE
ncbi:MAG: hypothetical protein Q4A01_03105 [Coriobacteriales bacterium]|nr:hypothetical protein [Coriobacteriales bacterium]